MSAPSFSVIIPAFKRYEGLGRTISNIVVQPEPEIKRYIHVVGDGYDPTIEEIANHGAAFAKKAQQDVEVIYTHTDICNHTGNIPRAKGLDEAKGDYVTFTDAGTSVVFGKYAILAMNAIEHPQIKWFVWDSCLLLDPVPTVTPAAYVKMIDKSRGMPYCCHTIAQCVSRELAQSVAWPNVRESDWAYFSKLWESLKGTGSIEEAEAKMMFLPMGLTIGYAGLADRRRRQPTPTDIYNSWGCDQGWTEDLAWQKRFGTQPMRPVTSS